MGGSSSSPCCDKNVPPETTEVVETHKAKGAASSPQPTEKGLMQLNDALRRVIPEGLRFTRDSEMMTSDDAKNKMPLVAKVLKEYPGSSILITGYAEPPSSASKKGMAFSTSLKRAMAVREALKESHSVTNEMACEGMGHMDDIGGRCELRGTTDTHCQQVLQREDELVMSPMIVARREIDDAMGSGILFTPGFATLKEGQEDRIKQVGDVMLRHSHGLAYKIVCFTGRPGHKLTPDQAACKNLSLKRSNVLRNEFQQQGLVDTPILCEGRGHADELGVRVEIQPLLKNELEGEDAQEEKDHMYNNKAMNVGFATKGNAELHDAFFTKKPLGITFGTQAPLIVVKVSAGSEGERKGVKVGMTVRMVNGTSYVSKDYQTAYKEFTDMVAKLPAD